MDEEDCNQMSDKLAYTLLPIYQERSNQLVNIINAANGLIVTILIGVLAFAGSVKNIQEPQFITLIVAICIISIIIWRAYAHYVDNDIVQMYGKILCCELKLNVPFRASLLASLIKGLPKDNHKRNELDEFVKSKNFSEAYSKMFMLIDERKVGPRGHDSFDKIALIFIISILLLGSYLTIHNVTSYQISAFVGFSIASLWAFVLFLIVIYPTLDIPKNPD